MTIDYLLSTEFLYQLLIIVFPILLLYEMLTGNFRRWVDGGNVREVAKYCDLVSAGEVKSQVHEGNSKSLIFSDSNWRPLSQGELLREIRELNREIERVAFLPNPKLAYRHSSGKVLIQFSYHYLILERHPPRITALSRNYDGTTG